MAGEEWARRILEKALNQTVSLNDNGSAPGMYDLRIGPAGAPEMAIECVGAVDSTFTETWNIGPARGPLKLTLRGDWMIEIAAKARVKVIKERVQSVLQELEGRGIHEVLVNHWLRRSDAALFDEIGSLNITHVVCYNLQGTGKVQFVMPGIGGAVDDRGDAVPNWVVTFLSDSARQDVLDKLQRSGAPDRHAFVIVGFGGAPWAVESYLTGGVDHLPVQAPNLPSPLTGVWVVSGLGRRAIHWDGVAWQQIETRGEGIEL